MSLCKNKTICLYVKINRHKKTAADILIQAAGFISFTIN